jgi:hypothetical protein
MAARFIDPDHPFFAAKWRRVAVVAVCVAWGALEALLGNYGWMALFFALAGWCAWVLLRPVAGAAPQAPDTPSDDPPR